MIMNEKHTCKICLVEVGQLVRHLTMKHEKMTLMEYLTKFNCGEEYTTIYNRLRSARAKNSPWSIEYYTARGMTSEEGYAAIDVKRATRKNPKTTPSQKEHWINKGLSEKDADHRVKNYLDQIGKLPSLTEYQIKYGPILGLKKYDEYKCKINNRQQKYMERLITNSNIYEAKFIQWYRRSLTEHGPVRKPFNYEDFSSYCKAVGTATKLSVAVYGDEIDPGRDKLGIIYGRNGWALDHKYSKYGGFINKIHPLVIGSKYNLCLIPIKENIQKGQYCSIQLAEVKQFKTILDDPNLSSSSKEIINEIFI